MTNPEFPDEPFSCHDIERLGISRRRLRDALSSGALRRVVTGVYVRTDLPDTIELRAAAVAMVVSPHSVVCDRTAAWLHGIDVFGYGDLEVLPPVETCVLRGHSPTVRQGVDGRTRDLRDDDVMELNGVRVTTPLRTALDLGCCLGRRRAIAALDGFMRLHHVKRADMLAALPRYGRRRGVVQLRELVPLADPRSESQRESWLRIDIHDAGLPAPHPQYWIEIDGVPTFRLDLAYPRHKIVVEYDGEEFHRRTEEQKANDAERRKWLRQHGWTVIVVDKDGLASNDPDEWIRELRRALRSRTRRLRWTKTPN